MPIWEHKFRNKFYPPKTAPEPFLSKGKAAIDRQIEYLKPLIEDEVRRGIEKYINNQS